MIIKYYTVVNNACGSFVKVEQIADLKGIDTSQCVQLIFGLLTCVCYHTQSGNYINDNNPSA